MTGLPRLLTGWQSAIAGRDVRVLRVRAGWTQADLGKLVGLSVSRVSRMESGERLFSDEELTLLADFFRVTAADLLPERADCANCQGAPAPGFACLACGTGDQVTGGLAARLDAGSVPARACSRGAGSGGSMSAPPISSGCATTRGCRSRPSAGK